MEYNDLVYTLADIVSDRSERGLRLINRCLILAKNEALSMHDWTFTEGTSTIQVQSGVNEYSLPQDFDRLHHVFSSKGALSYKPPEEIFRLKAENTEYTGVPSYYSVYGSKLHIYPPKPSADTLVLLYKKDLTQATSELFNPSPFKKKFYGVLIAGGYYWFIIQTAGIEEILEARRKFEDALVAAIRADIKTRTSEAPLIKDLYAEDADEW